MGSFPLSLVPFQFEGVQANCAWSPEPVFTLEESARLLGTNKHNLRVNVRRKYPEVRLPKGVFNLSTPFGPSLTEFGEVTILLATPGGPQEHVCLTHYGLFRHAVYIRTREARRYVLEYPRIVAAIVSRTLRPPSTVSQLYRDLLSAPRGTLERTAKELARQLGKGERTIWNHLRKIRLGQVTPDGLPIRRVSYSFHHPDRVKALRVRLGLDRRAFSARVGVDMSTIRDWEAGAYGIRAPNVAKLRATCPSPDLAWQFEMPMRPK